MCDVTIGSGGFTCNGKLGSFPRADDPLRAAQQKFKFLGNNPRLGSELVELFLKDTFEAYEFLREELHGEIGDDVGGETRVTLNSETWVLSRLRAAANLYGVQFVKEESEESASHPPQKLCIYFRYQGNYPQASKNKAGVLRISLLNATQLECLDLMLAIAGTAGWSSLAEYECCFNEELEGPLGSVIGGLRLVEPLRVLAAARSGHRESLG
jgi:hypothetical protein